MPSQQQQQQQIPPTGNTNTAGTANASNTDAWQQYCQQYWSVF
jgi:hypothetical protein